MSIKRGDIHVAALDPVIGREIAKTRPVVVISNDKNNQFSATVTVIPLTSGKPEKEYPFEVFLPKGIGDLPKDSRAKADQIRTIDKSRLVACIGKLGTKDMSRIEEAIRVHLQLP